MASNTPTRRSLLSAMAIAPIVIAAPAVAMATGCPVFRACLDASENAQHRFNTLPDTLEGSDPAAYERETQVMCAAANNADQAVPTTPAELERWLKHIVGGNLSGSIDAANTKRLMAHLSRIL